MHTHDYCEIIGCIQGKGKFIVEGSEYPLEPGGIMVLRPFEAHMLSIDADHPYERIMIHFGDRFVRQVDPEERLLKLMYDRPLGVHNLYRSHDFPGANGIGFLKRMAATGQDRMEQKLSAQVNLYAMLYEMREIFESKLKNQTGTTRSSAQTLIDYVNEHLHEELTLEHLSRVFFLSKSQISRIFKQATGSSVIDYVVAKRLLQAREYILAGETAGNASQRCGFNHYSNFYRLYKRQFGVSPSESHHIDHVTVKTSRD